MKKLLLSSSLATIVVMALNFGFKIYFSHKIDKNALAIFYTFMDIVSVVLMFFSGFKDSLVKAYDEGEFERVFSWYLLVFLGGIVFSLGVVGVFYSALGIAAPFVYFAVITLANSVVVFVSYANAAHKNYRVMLFENLAATLGLIVSYFVLESFFSGFFLLFYSFLGSMTVRLVYLMVLRNFKLQFLSSRFDASVQLFLKNTLYSSLMYFFSGLFISSSSIVLLKLYNDANVLGDFQVVVKSIFFSLVAVFVFPLNTYLFPEISKFMSQKSFDVVKSLERKIFRYLGVFFVFLLGATFFTKFAISLVFPPTYVQSYKMLNAMLPFLPFIAYTTFALNIIKGANRFAWALIVRVIGSVVFFITISLLYLLDFDARYIVVALDAAFVSMAGVSLYFRRRLL